MDDAFEAAREVLTNWDLDVARLEAVSESENIVFRVEARDGQAYALRLHRPGYHTLAELQSEHVWTGALRSAGIDVPVPRLTRSGTGYAACELRGERRYAGLLEWVDGTPMRTLIERGTEGTDWYRQLGLLLATLHNQAASWNVPAGFTRPELDADGLMGEAPFWGRFWESPALDAEERRWFAALRHRVRNLLLTQDRSPPVYGVIHADLHSANVIVHGSRLHIIDFDDAAFGWFLYDIAIALLPFPPQPDFERAQRALIAGYRSVRSLPDAVLDPLPLFFVARALAQIGWFAERPEHSDSSFLLAALDFVRTHAERIVTRFEA